MEHAHKEERRHEMRELGRATRNWRAEKEDLKVRLSTFSEGLNDANQLGGSRGEVLKLRSSEIAGNGYFSIHSCIFEAFKDGNQVTRKGALCPRL